MYSLYLFFLLSLIPRFYCYEYFVIFFICTHELKFHIRKIWWVRMCCNNSNPDLTHGLIILALKNNKFLWYDFHQLFYAISASLNFFINISLFYPAVHFVLFLNNKFQIYKIFNNLIIR